MLDAAEWDDLQRDIVHCTRCGLCQTRTKSVPGQGTCASGLMFVGEAPGGQEDVQGEAFVGPAGKLLTELVHGIGLQREDVFITNIVKCRPPGNRNPHDVEIEKCLPYLRKQVRMLQPTVICTLGNFAFKSLVQEDRSISNVRGQFFRKGAYTFFATYHPAFAIRNREFIDVMKRDFALLGQKVRSLHGNHHHA